MNICQSSTTKWFEAALHNDLPQIRKMIDDHNSQRDSRKSDKDNNTFNDFTALLYTSLLDFADITQLLIPLEYHLPTTQTITLPCNGITSNRNYSKEIPAGTSPFELAILCNSKRTVRQFFNYFTQKNIDIPVEQNPTIQLSLCRYFDTSLLNMAFIQRYFTAEALRNACVYGRMPQLQQFLELEQTPLKFELYKALMERSSGGQTCQQLCAVAVDYALLEVNKQEKEACLKAITEISQRAVDELNEMGKAEAYLAEDFKKCFEPSEVE